MTTWDDPTPKVRSDSTRTAKYRRLQSWNREVQLGARAGASGACDVVGSMLHPDDVARQPDLNFIHPSAYQHAVERAEQVQDENGTLEQGRLMHNMLSSRPLCFNLFGALRDEPGFLPLFRELFDPAATSITEVVCEWAPDREVGIGDRTAFDAVVFYERSDGPAFMGIETKYTEPFSRKAYDTPATGRSPRRAAGSPTPTARPSACHGRRRTSCGATFFSPPPSTPTGPRGGDRSPSSPCGPTSAPPRPWPRSVPSWTSRPASGSGGSRSRPSSRPHYGPPPTSPAGPSASTSGTWPPICPTDPTPPPTRPAPGTADPSPGPDVARDGCGERTTP